MIRYTLLCEREHEFESWFRDSAAFEQLAAAKQAACPTCGSTTVRKAMMMPSVVTSRTRRTGAVAAEAAAPPSPAPDTTAAADPHPVALMNERAKQLRAMMRDVHRRVTETADNVGRAFAVEARAIHDGQSPARSIYGEASRDEVAALLDDGIPLLPLPVPPDDHH